MNSSKISFIFAGVLGVILSASPVDSFSYNTNADTSAKAQLLHKGTEVQFSSYIQENLTRFSKKDEWKTVEKIVTTYSQSPSKLLSSSVADQQAFTVAAKTLAKKLNRQKDEKAEQWSRNLTKTVNNIQVIWNFDLDSLTPKAIETPLYVAPADVKSAI
ncbi:hypothetical protein [Persicitalea jodogahamensis]|uniref:Uncharacterized protein n=1 Tax=Persicitalea jodogahamensis TaxID=402147 RepID=A0A8J3D9J8_9BACT|nr:hypothetical protein [Persicitalea jodogahamensis]GHB72469.1 hypothetical protein GCM10007390_28160 [Persicitalea jodogahamensis]